MPATVRTDTGVQTSVRALPWVEVAKTLQPSDTASQETVIRQLDGKQANQDSK